MNKVTPTGTEAWREALKIINRCQVCSTNYNAEDARVFAHEDFATLVYLTCRSCRAGFMAMVIKLGGGISSVGMVTDLNYLDLKRLHLEGPVEIDEVIDASELINNPDFIYKLVNY